MTQSAWPAILAYFVVVFLTIRVLTRGVSAEGVVTVILIVLIGVAVWPHWQRRRRKTYPQG